MSSKKTPIRKDGLPLSIAKKTPPTAAAPVDIEQASTTFPTEALPEVIRRISEEVAEVYNLPVEMPAAMALATFSAALGDKVYMRHGSFDSYPNLYVLISAASGTGKSVAFNSILSPFREKEKAEQRRREPGRLTALAKIELAQASRKNAKEASVMVERDQEIAELTKQSTVLRFMIEDATSQALVCAASSGDGVLFSASPDARGCILNLLGRNTKGETDEDILLKGWSGEGHRRDRVKEEGPTIVEGMRLALLWAVQPDLARKLWGSSSLRTSGFLPRCLYLSMPIRYSPSTERRVDRFAASAWSELIGETMDKYRTGKHTNEIRPSEAAAKVLRDFEIEASEAATSEPDVGAFIARHHEQASRMAIVLHLGGENRGAAQVSEDTARSAVALARWFAAEQRRAFSFERDKALSEQFADLQSRAAKDEKDHVTPYMVSRSHWARDTVEGEAILRVLSSHGYGEWREEPGDKGRPKRGLFFD